MMLDTLIATLQEKRANLGNVDVKLLNVSTDGPSEVVTDGTGISYLTNEIRQIVTMIKDDQTEILVFNPREG